MTGHRDRDRGNPFRNSAFHQFLKLGEIRLVCPMFLHRA
jgi:hypothetical protein